MIALGIPQRPDTRKTISMTIVPSKSMRCGESGATTKGGIDRALTLTKEFECRPRNADSEDDKLNVNALIMSGARNRVPTFDCHF